MAPLVNDVIETNYLSFARHANLVVNITVFLGFVKEGAVRLLIWYLVLVEFASRLPFLLESCRGIQVHILRV